MASPYTSVPRSPSAVATFRMTRASANVNANSSAAKAASGVPAAGATTNTSPVAPSDARAASTAAATWTAT